MRLYIFALFFILIIEPILYALFGQHNERFANFLLFNILIFVISIYYSRLLPFGNPSIKAGVINQRSIDFALIILILIAGTLLLNLIGSSSQNFTLTELYNFRLNYREGAFSGTFFYTFLSTKIIPLILSVLIATEKRLNLLFWCAVFYTVVVSILLGLRIFLLIYLVAFLLRPNVNHFRLLFISIFFVLLLIFTKLLVHSDPNGTIVSVTLNLFMRHELDLLLIDEFHPLTLGQVLNTAPIYHIFSGGNFKVLLMDISSGFNEYIGEGSPMGAAFPLNLYVMNTFGVIGFPIFCIVSFVWFISIKLFYRMRRFSTQAITLYIVNYTFITIIDDFYAISALVELPIIICVLLLFELLTKKKLLLSNKVS